jgi:uncharacterized protein involved in exopolysaccharide biosynthesis
MIENRLPPDSTVAPAVELRDVIAVLRARWVWMLIGAVAGATLLLLVSFMMKPVYRATVVLAPSRIEQSGGGGVGAGLGRIGGLASLAGIDIGAAQDGTEEALAVFRSRILTERFLADHGILPMLFADEWDTAAKKWKSSKDAPTLAQGFKSFDEDIRRIGYDRKSGLVTLAIEWTDPTQAAVWANELVDRVNEEMRSRALSRANASIAFLEKELEKTTVVETRSAINRLLESQINQRMLANVTQEYAFRVIDRALPADPKDKVRPKRVVFVALGFVLGGVLALFAVLLVRFESGRRR